MLYLESTAVACYQASEELGMSFASIFGATSRSNAFYTKHSDHIQANEFTAFFLKERGVENVVNILEYANIENNNPIPLSTVWLCISAIPLGNTPEHTKLKETLLNRLQIATEQDKEYIRQHAEATNYFLENINKNSKLAGKEFFIAHFIKKSILEESTTIPVLPINEKHEEMEVVEKIAAGIQDLKGEIDLVNENLNKVEMRRMKVSGKTCDECEREVLENIERLLDHNKISDALEIIRWRQEEIKQCNIDYCMESAENIVALYINVVV